MLTKTKNVSEKRYKIRTITTTVERELVRMVRDVVENVVTKWVDGKMSGSRKGRSRHKRRSHKSTQYKEFLVQFE